MTKPLVRWAAGLLAAGCLAATAAAQAPERPIRIVLGFQPGGGADVMMRVLAQQLSQQLGQPVVIDNKPGAEGMIAADHVAKAPADGNTLFFASNGPMVALPILRGRPAVPYDAFKDFTPVAILGRFAMFLVTGPDVPVRSADALLARIRANPGAMNYASSSTVARMAAIQFLRHAETNVTHVPYKGDAPALTDLMAGRVQLMFATGAAIRGYVTDDRVRALAVLRDTRSPQLPEVPTAREAGLRIAIAPWAGLYGPVGMAPATAERLNGALRAAVAGKEVREQLELLGFEPAISTPAAMAALQREEHEAFRKAVQEEGIRFE